MPYLKYNYINLLTFFELSNLAIFDDNQIIGNLNITGGDRYYMKYFFFFFFKFQNFFIKIIIPTKMLLYINL
jgi:hypothetical protein